MPDPRPASSPDLIALVEQHADAIRDDVIAWRRHLHAHPELSFAEHETSAWIAEQLDALGAFTISRPTETSVMAVLRGPQPGPTLALRADIDALPIQEQTGLPFASTRDGVMHGCGHDGHASILLGVAHVLARAAEQIRGEIRLLFQHGEETFPGGAGQLVAAGVMDGVDRVVGLHLWSPLPTGQVVVQDRNVMAACDIFTITIDGVGGHIAQPHTTVDPIVVGAEVVTALQQIVARNVDPQEPAVLSVTGFHAGETIGVIPPTAILHGGTNSLSPAVQDLLERRIDEVVQGVCAAAGCRGSVDYQRGYAAVINDPAVAADVRAAVTAVLGPERLVARRPEMVGEDVSAYMREAPGCFLLLGAGDPSATEVFEHHHPRFDIDEAALHDGVRLLATVALAPPSETAVR